MSLKWELFVVFRSNGYQGKLDADMTTELFKEAAVMKSFEHQNVLKLHGVTLDTVYRNEFWNQGDFTWNPKIIESSLVRATLVSLVSFQTETYTIGSESLFPKVLDWLQHIWIRVIYENFLEIAITNLVINRFVNCNINHMIWIISKPILVHKIRSKCCQWYGIPSPKECHSPWFGS